MKKLFFASAIALIFALVSSFAQPRGGCSSFGPEHRFEGVGHHFSGGKLSGFHFYKKRAEDLSLSDSQIDKMKEKVFAFEKEMIDLKGAVKRAAIEMKQEASKDKISEGKLSQALDNMLKAKNKAVKKAFKHKMDLYNMLNDEQKKKLKELRKECRGKMREMRFRRGSDDDFKERIENHRNKRRHME